MGERDYSRNIFLAKSNDTHYIFDAKNGEEAPKYKKAAFTPLGEIVPRSFDLQTGNYRVYNTQELTDAVKRIGGDIIVGVEIRGGIAGLPFRRYLAYASKKPDILDNLEAEALPFGAPRPNANRERKYDNRFNGVIVH